MKTTLRGTNSVKDLLYMAFTSLITPYLKEIPDNCKVDGISPHYFACWLYLNPFWANIGLFCKHYVNMAVSQPCGHLQHGDNFVNYVLGTLFHAMQLSSILESLDIQCSGVDIQTHNFTIHTVPASLPDVSKIYLRLAHFWTLFYWILTHEWLEVKTANFGRVDHLWPHKAGDCDYL